MEITNIYIYGFKPAIKSIRNAMQSWDKSDSTFESKIDILTGIKYNQIGEKDLKLASNLVKAGDSDSKFLRGITAAFDIKAPTYWIAELATYKIGTTMNSSSLQHTGSKREFNINDFEIDNADVVKTLNRDKKLYDMYYDWLDLDNGAIFTEEENETFYLVSTWQSILEQINHLRDKYNKTKDYKYFRLMRQIIPQSFIYTITWTGNYQTLRNIYKQRRHHKLVEWQQFCNAVETLPYAKELITIGIDR